MGTIRLFGLLIYVVSAVCAGCGSTKSYQQPYTASEQPSTSDSKSTAANSAPAGKPAGVDRDMVSSDGRATSDANPTAQRISLDQTQNSTIDTAPTDRKIIRNADLNLESDSPEQAQQKITSIAEGKGGFVVESQASSSDVKATSRDIVTMTVRVPAQKFNETLDEIRKTASRVIVETVKGEDVTEEFIDIQARLNAKKALEQQFIEIMKRANTVNDALSVQSQLAEVRGEIEKIEGRKRFLENQASLSTIKIRLQTPAAFSASSKGFFYRLAESFSTGLDFALNFVLGLVTLLIALLPFAIFIVLPIFLLVRYLVRRRGKTKTVSDIVKEEIDDN